MKYAKGSVQSVLYEAPGPKTRRWTAALTALSVLALTALAVAVVYRFYEAGQLRARYWDFFRKGTTWRFIWKGLAGTLQVAGASGLMAFAAGFVLMLGKIGKVKLLRGICTALIEFTRGVPTLLFIYFFFLVVPQLGIRLSSFWKVSVPVAISACGVVAEVLRSGVNAVPRGQSEAAVSLGMRDFQVFRKVVFPQALRMVVPALIAELVIVVKDTTFAYVVNYPDLMQNAKVLISNYDALLSVYLVVAVIYILLNFILNKISEKLATGSQIGV